MREKLIRSATALAPGPPAAAREYREHLAGAHSISAPKRTTREILSASQVTAILINQWNRR